MRRWIFTAIATVACSDPDLASAFTQLEVEIAASSDEANGVFASVIDDAQDTLRVALPVLEDERISDALISAWDRGVDVELVTDYDHREATGAAAALDANLPVALADNALAYFDFGTNLDLAWESDQVMMSHAYVVADGLDVWTATKAGDLDPGSRVMFHLTGEDVAEDFSLEHIQLFGGTDASATTAFDAPAKSITDARWVYPNQTEVTAELWFGPQERLTKRVIDGIYNARSSVRILTDDFSNNGIIAAMQSKASYGFDMEITVGPRFGSASTPISDLLLDTTPDVTKLQWTGPGALPTLVFVDADDSSGGAGNNAKVMVISHDLYAAARLYNNGVVITDQLIDGHMWVLEAPGEPQGAIAELFSFYADIRLDSQVLP